MPKGRTSYQVTRTDVSGASLLRLEGVIDETFDSQQLVAPRGATMVLDLDGVRRITSYGIREWMNSVRRLELGYLGYVRCRPSMVSQFNMVSSFAGPGELLSFYAPYLCPSCNKDLEILVDRRKQYSELRAMTMPDVPCPDCGAMAQFDDSPEVYLAYAGTAPLPAPPPVVDDLLNGGAEKGERLKAEKDVQGNITAVWLAGTLDGSTRLRRIFDGLEGQVVLGIQGVRRATADGVAQLRPVLDDPSLDVYLVDLPEAVAKVLHETGQGIGRASVMTFCLDFACLNRHVFNRRVVSPERLRSHHQGEHEGCPQCDAAMRPLLDAAVLTTLAQLPVRDAPAEVVELVNSPRSRTPSVAVTPAGGRPGPVHNDEQTRVGQAFGRYELIRPIGSGGMAEVFLARQTGLGGFEKEVVLKRILHHLSQNQAFVEMFLQEARVAARISHPNVVQIFDVGQVNNQYFIAMEYVPGWDLNAVLRVATRLARPFPVAVALRVMADVCAGLHAAHTCTDESGQQRGIIHRDVSPHNVLISHSGQVKLTDFGIAKAISGNEGNTPSSTLKGKLSYMAPEQVRPAGRALDPRVDIFPAALILYQCLTVDHPFKGDTEFETMRAILNDAIPPVTARRADVPPEVDEILERGMARDREQRFPTAKAMQAQLEALLGRTGEPATAEVVAAFIRETIELGREKGIAAAGSPLESDDEGTLPTVAEGSGTGKRPA